jgi:methyltransferase (TIGR00027 family)
MNGHPFYIRAGDPMRADRPSRTAFQNALFRALEARKTASSRLADDTLAVRFLPTEFRLLAGLARAPAGRRLIEALIDHRWPCVRGGVVARTRLIDETVAAELPRVRQVLILGAGFDSRAYRLAGMHEVTAFEVDHPATQAIKQAVLTRGASPLHHVRFVPVVFGTDDPGQKLAAAGFAACEQTLVLWEGVTNYLDPAAVDATFRFLAAVLGPGSPVVFTYVDRRMLDGQAVFAGAKTTMRAVRRVGEPFTFGLDPAEVAGYLAGRGFTLEWDTTVSEAAARLYPAGHCPTVPAYYHVTGSRRA